jgi:GNAT superfamily N-acetyltransferase
LIEPVTDVDARAAAYLEGLNACFPGWGGPESFDWCFRRTLGGPPADLFIVEEEGALIAGSAIVYRRALRAGAGAPERLAIMSGSWTLPAARGRGIFKRMIQASRDRAGERGCGLLIAFAHGDNPSAYALAAAGATIVPSFYLASPGPTVSNGIRPEPASGAERAFAARSFPLGASRIHYEPGEWRSQMLDRPRPTEALQLDGGLVAICEPGPGATRLLDVSATGSGDFTAAAIEAAAHANGLTAYSNDQACVEPMIRAGFSSNAGGVYLLGTAGDPVPPEPWWFANGDRM